MLIIRNRKSFLTRRSVFFAQKPSFKMGLFNYYIQSFYIGEIPGFKRYAFFTKLIDLSDPNFMHEFDNATLYDIRKSKKDGIFCSESKNIEEFVSFYNRFQESKKLAVRISQKDILEYGDNLIVRNAYLPDGALIVLHSYLVDRSLKRARLLSSASTLHDKETTPRLKSIIGRANRHLHYEDMIFFKSNGISIYDFGGYALGTSDCVLQGINYFKDRFGGVLSEESNYELYIIYLVKLVINFIANVFHNLLKVKWLICL